jgi:hypothetical protein
MYIHHWVSLAMLTTRFDNTICSRLSGITDASLGTRSYPRFVPAAFSRSLEPGLLAGF